ncbi:DUF2057 family protein [Shewanella sp. UCD-KL12]|uniref:DUF2057 family protein n=1 Tax=Shewanella sp. UCD-KL12 TaxID=1917163 RepID=UPI0009704A79|nr:DUF2057 family protein [Shewanella sp. UCD-KL12]
MKLLTKTALSAIITIASASAFAASVSLPNNLQVSEINGVKVGNSQEFQMANGQNLVSLKYVEDFAVNADDSGALIKSEPLFWHVSVQDGTHYTITIPELNTQDEARNFVNNPVIQVSNNKGATRTANLANQYQLMAGLLRQEVQM